jgi:hypothetical protein
LSLSVLTARSNQSCRRVVRVILIIRDRRHSLTPLVGWRQVTKAGLGVVDNADAVRDYGGKVLDQLIVNEACLPPNGATPCSITSATLDITVNGLNKLRIPAVKGAFKMGPFPSRIETKEPPPKKTSSGRVRQHDLPRRLKSMI